MTLVAERREGGVRTLTLASPERRNALDAAARSALASWIARSATDGVRVLVIEGSGNPSVFCAGADLREIGGLDPASARALSAEGQALTRALARLPAIVLAACSGPCRGGGLDLALACDVVLAGDDATFAHPGARLGLMTGWGGTRLLQQRAGLGPALAATATGRKLSAREAEALGLVDEVFPALGFASRVTGHAAAWAVRAAAFLPGEILAIKAVLGAPRGLARSRSDAYSCRLLAAR